ncbi:MAG: cobalamin-binding protein [Firmicutes bacterium]|jgi:iron complex transport system substrate-binding protein|nr:cobalamin-binding protein [Bacillota bacterium]
MKIRSALLLALMALIIAVAAGCAAPAAGGDTNDDAASEMRIVSLMPSNTEILFALGLGEALVGVTDYCNYPPELEEAVAAGRIQRVGDAFNVNEELLISLEPTLVVFGYSTEAAQNLADRLNDLGINTEIIFPQTVQQTMESIIRLGDLTGTGERAAALVAEMETAFADAAAATAELPAEDRPKVLMLLDLDSLYVAGTGTLENELIKAAGGVNIVETAGYPQISEEAIIAGNPDIILCSFPFKDRILSEKEAWKELTAVQAEAVYDLEGDLINRPGPRLEEGLKLMQSIIHSGR